MSYKPNEKGRAKYREHRWKRRLKALAFLGNACRKCGFSDLRALQIDHVNGGGWRERKGSYHEMIYKLVYKNPDDYQLLCANCNWIKKYENNESRCQVD